MRETVEVLITIPLQDELLADIKEVSEFLNVTHLPVSDVSEVPEEVWAKTMETIPLKRPQVPEDIASVVLFLSSDVARNITGEAVSINGGARVD